MKINSGFTLIETLVAITILVMAVITPFYSINRALIASYTARDQLAATSLAAEGLEYVHGVRDANYISNYNGNTPVSWMGSLDGTTGVGLYNQATNADCFSRSCVVDMYTHRATMCAADDPDCLLKPLYLSAPLYNQTKTGTATRFSRAISLTQINATEVLVKVRVSWKVNNNVPYNVTVTEYLDNWLE